MLIELETSIREDRSVADGSKTADSHDSMMPAGTHLPAWMGIEYGEPSGGRITAVLSGRPETNNYRGDVHGGTMATLADVTMAAAVWSETPSDRLPVTSDLSIRYLRRASGPLVAEAKIVRLGGNSAVAEVLITDSGGEPVCAATGGFQILRISRSVVPEEAESENG